MSVEDNGWEAKGVSLGTLLSVLSAWKSFKLLVWLTVSLSYSSDNQLLYIEVQHVFTLICLRYLCVSIIHQIVTQTTGSLTYLHKLLTFSRHIAHNGTTENFSLPAASATDGRQALHHSWMRLTPMCGTNVKNSTAGLLIVKWIQLLLVFSWGFQPPQRVINLDPAF